jgi:hypothetical protein
VVAGHFGEQPYQARGPRGPTDRMFCGGTTDDVLCTSAAGLAACNGAARQAHISVSGGDVVATALLVMKNRGESVADVAAMRTALTLGHL